MVDELVSIIVPVYNVQDYLETCLNSIAQQTYSRLEVILVDDGSTDKSGEICDNFSKKDGRFVVIHKQNGGVSSARNEALKHIHGWSVAFVDSDDTIDLNYVENMVGEMLAYKVNFVRARFKKNGVPLDNFVANDKKETILFDLSSIDTLELLAYAGGIMLRTSCIGDNLFDESIAYGEDQLFLSSCFFKSKSSKILLLGGSYYNYTYRESSASNENFNERWFTLKKAADEIVDTLKPYPEALKLSLYTKKNFYLLLYKKLVVLKNKSQYKEEINALRKEILSLRASGVKSTNFNIDFVEMSYIYGFHKIVEKFRKMKHRIFR